MSFANRKACPQCIKHPNHVALVCDHRMEGASMFLKTDWVLLEKAQI